MYFYTIYNFFYFVNIIYQFFILGHIALNVLGWRRFCCPNKRNRRFRRAVKMWVEQNTVEGAARTVFCGTLEPPNGGGTLTVCYVLVCRTPLFLLYYFFFTGILNTVFNLLVSVFLKSDKYIS